MPGQIVGTTLHTRMVHATTALHAWLQMIALHA
jgi:hypothetical protein